MATGNLKILIFLFLRNYEPPGQYFSVSEEISVGIMPSYF
jgi:hypothetical protein